MGNSRYMFNEKLKHVLENVRETRKLKIGFLGGSITEGYHASTSSNCYASKVCSKLQDYFKEIEVSKINAGIGATGSLIGVHRVEDDLLAYKPNVVIIEFAANDIPPNELTAKSYESLIRRVMKSLPNSAIITVFMAEEDGQSAAQQEKEISAYYYIPSIDFRKFVFDGIKADQFKWRDLMSDEVHPNDRGHELLAQSIVDLIIYTYKQVDIEEHFYYSIPKPLHSGYYEQARILSRNNLIPLCSEGFSPSDEGFRSLSKGWKLDETATEAVFECEIAAKAVHLLYIRGIEKERGNMQVEIDGQEKVSIDTFFPDGWGNYAATSMLIEEEENRLHKIRIKYERRDGKLLLNILGFLVTE